MGTGGAGRVDVLLIEDDPRDARLVAEAFEEARLDNPLHVVTDGAEALDFVYQRDAYTEAPRPDLILLDRKLAGTSGRDGLARLKGDADLETIPVVVLTGPEVHSERAESNESPADAYVTRPVELDELIDVICSFEEFGLNIVRVPPEDDE